MPPFPYLGFGLGLRTPHYDEIITTRPKAVEWFEIISENFMEAHPGHWDFLHDLRADYPILLHGVSLNIGSTDPLDKTYLAKLKALADFVQTPWVSDHFCWTGVEGIHTHDLLPLPYTEEALKHLIPRIRQVQETLERPLVLENPSSYLQFANEDFSEADFLAALIAETGIGMLLDINNVYVTGINHGLDPKTYIDTLPAASIAHVHLAGHHPQGSLLIDTHGTAVSDAVWDLYRYTLAQKAPLTTMIEWDEKLPPFSTLVAELEKARQIATPYLRTHAA